MDFNRKTKVLRLVQAVPNMSAWSVSSYFGITIPANTSPDIPKIQEEVYRVLNIMTDESSYLHDVESIWDDAVGNDEVEAFNLKTLIQEVLVPARAVRLTILYGILESRVDGLTTEALASTINLLVGERKLSCIRLSNDTDPSIIAETLIVDSTKFNKCELLGSTDQGDV